MPNIIKHKKNSVAGTVPATGVLDQAELAINIADGKFYTKNSSNVVINLGVTSISGTSITPASGNFGYLAVSSAQVVTGGGTSGYLPKFNSSQGVTNSLIFDNGNVGIGTVAPSALFSVHGGITNNYTAVALSTDGVSTTTHVGVGNSDSRPFLASLNSNLSTSIYGWGFFDRGADGFLNIQRRGGAASWVSVMTMDRTNGNVGIGTGVQATTPPEKLTVDGNIRVADTAVTQGKVIQFSRGGGDQYDYTIGRYANALAISLTNDPNIQRPFQVGYHSGATFLPKFHINGYTGDVGIGTTSPVSKLQVSGLVTANSGTFGNIMISGNMVSATNSNGNLIIKPNASGSLQADNAGNSRGIFSVDLQRSRTSVSGVAHGDYSVIGGGRDNRSAGNNSIVGGGYSNSAGDESTVGGGNNNSAGGGYYGGCTVGGGNSNIANGLNSTVGGGKNNSAGGGYYGCSTVGGGKDNSAIGRFSTIGGGQNNSAGGYRSTIGGGNSNSAGGYYSTVGGGNSNNASGFDCTIGGGASNSASNYQTTVGGGQSNSAGGYHSTVPGGFQAKATRHGETSHSAGQFTNKGDAQHTILIARNSTVNASGTVLFLDGSSSRLTIPAETTWIFTIKLSAYNDTDNLSAGYNIRGCIRRNAASGTSIIGSNIVESWVEGAMSGCVATATADDTNEALQINVTGLASKNIRWVAVVDISQVSYAAP